MIQGLSVGLSAAGTSLGTHGREGGAPEVQEFYQKQEQGKQQAAQAAQALKSQQLQNQLTSAQTNEANFRVRQMQGSFHDEQAKTHFERVNAEQGTIGQAQDIRTKALQDFTATGDIGAYQKTLSQLDAAGGSAAPADQGGAPAAPGTTPAGTPAGAAPAAPVQAPGAPVAGAAPVIPPQAKAVWQNSVDSAASAYPNDPQIKQYAQTLTDPTASPMQLAAAANGAKNRMAALDAGTESRTKQEAALANSPISKLSTAEALANPGAQAAIQAKIDDPTTSREDVLRLRALLPQAAVAQNNAANLKAREARLVQIANAGDPKLAGRMLADRTLTLAELKTRFTRPEDIETAVAAAQKIDPNYKPAIADREADQAGSAENTRFFGNTDSLLVKGGSLDQLQQAYKNLGNTAIPAINDLENLRKAALGSGPIADAYAAQLGVADDLAKVISGTGAGSDKSRQDVLNIMKADLSPAGQAASINRLRAVVESQRNGRIGINPYMKERFPDPSTLQETPGVAGTQRAPQTKAPSGKAVSLAAARALPINKGKTDAEIRAHIQAHGYQVGE